jgi:cation transport ATPase
MAEGTFYTAAASTSFALLGFWWVVVSQRYRDWIRYPARRRQAYSISMYFMLPALMSLASLVGPKGVWRVAFAASALLGLFEVLTALSRADRDRLGMRVRVFLASAIPLFLVIVAIAIHPTLPKDLGFSLTALETEAVMVVILLLLGVNFAWWLLFEEFLVEEAADLEVPRDLSG